MEFKNKNEKLFSEIEKVRKEIKTDNLSMAIRELVQIYKDGDLELFPSYQRLFRWDDEQKTRFVESILMGIPTPPIFIAQKKGSKWTIVDGLQRISTILQVMNVLEVKDMNGEVKPPFKFTYTEKLPALEGFQWDCLDDDVQRIIKMAKIDIKIILVEDNVHAQYELFKRLNTGGVVLQPQEIRNCLIIMINENFYFEINSLKDYVSFKTTIKTTKSKHEIEFPMELILRYFIMKNNKIDFKKYNLSSEVLSVFIDKETVELISDPSFDLDSEVLIFKRVFDLLNTILGDSSFKKYQFNGDKFTGSFNQSTYESIVVGLANNIDYYEKMDPLKFKEIIIQMHREPEFIDISSRGKKALTRIQSMIVFSNKYFENHGV